PSSTTGGGQPVSRFLPWAKLSSTAAREFGVLRLSPFRARNNVVAQLPCGFGPKVVAKQRTKCGKFLADRPILAVVRESSRSAARLLSHASRSRHSRRRALTWIVSN